MPAPAITFRGVSIYDGGTNGASWGPAEPTPPAAGAIEERAPRGTGHYLKPDGILAGSLSLPIAWDVSSPPTIRATVVGLVGHEVGALVLPTETFSRARLTVAPKFSERRGGTRGYIVEATLEFALYA